MQIIRQFIGFVYILCVLILSIDVLYYIFHGFIPSIIRGSLDSFMTFIGAATGIIAIPVAIGLDFVIKLLPFLGSFMPVTNTGIIEAQIHWVPLIALFVYSAILKAIDEFFLKVKITNIDNDYKRKQP